MRTLKQVRADMDEAQQQLEELHEEMLEITTQVGKGDLIVIGTFPGKYMLCHVGLRVMTAINMDSGNFLTAGVRVTDTDNINVIEIDAIVAHHNWRKV